jgi:VWFA-related protein
MKVKICGFPAIAWGVAAVACLALVAAVSAQAPDPAKPAPAPPQAPAPTFRVQVDLVTNDVVIRDEKGNFISDLKPEEFRVYEDGVLQDLASMTVVTGGRVYNPMSAPVAAAPEGIILPKKRAVSDVSGRIFLFFVDDQHLQFGNTGRVRELFKKISKELVHEGDLFGIVSSGPSSIQVDMTYDRSRIDETIKKMTGNELKPTEIINGAGGPGGPTEIRYRAHVAFSTMTDALKNLEAVHNRRKAIVWVSDGYDFAPFKDARYGTMDPNSPFTQSDSAQARNQAAAQNASANGGQAPDPSADPDVRQQMQQEQFADADLSRELYEITQAANRANTTIYTIDPRGLVGPMADLDENVDPQQWSEFVRKSQDSLRTLAEETGGIAVVNTNDFTKALKRVDAETSDYYVLGYYSKNPDILKRRRVVDVRVTRAGLTVWARKEYVLKPQPAPVSSTKP